MIATHPHQALRLLAEPTGAEQDLLGRIGYTVNPTLLHTDDSVLPSASKAEASWNYAMPSCTAMPTSVEVSYNMNRLQRLSAPNTYIVSLNADGRVAPDAVLARMDYEHPVYTNDSSRRASTCQSSTTVSSRLPARTTAGVSTRTAAGRACRPPPASASTGDTGEPAGPLCR